MARYLLVAGSATEEGKKYNWKDPANNVVESARNLAAEMPEKFKRLDEHLYEYDKIQERPAGAPQANTMSASMPKLDATTAKQVNREGKTLDERYGGDISILTLAELKEIAEAEEIPLPKPANAKAALTKEEVVKALRAAKP